uniref:HTH CENPB-type domain-containing protein n=1 Tax=Pelodiscus sinensis TaxID=13735 RepID=K7GJK9_PELSI
RSYTSAEKLKVVSFAAAYGNRAASREFDGIAKSNIRLWRRQKKHLQALPRMKMAERGKSAAYPELEAMLVEWIAEHRQQGGSVSIVEVRMKALTIAKMCANTAGFKASHGWGNRFMNRHSLSVQHRTTITQKLPMDSDTKLLQFQKFIIKLRKQHCYDLSLIGNADQTLLNFDNPYNRTLEVKGSKTVSIATTGHETSRFTVMLACTADGTKLPPYIVFKRKTMPKNVIFPNTVHVHIHPKGWIDEALMLNWLQTVWAKRLGGLMILDAFRCHHMPSIQKRLQQDKTDLAIIPGGMTKTLQPLDVTVNKPMKDAFCRKWNTWLLEGEHTFTAGGRMRTPTLQDVTQWIADVWAELDPAIIRKGFLKCRISNAMDGSEDDALLMDPSDDESSEGELPVCEDDNDLYYLD